jgi:hypothetical protein
VPNLQTKLQSKPALSNIVKLPILLHHVSCATLDPLRSLAESSKSKNSASSSLCCTSQILLRIIFSLELVLGFLRISQFCECFHFHRRFAFSGPCVTGRGRNQHTQKIRKTHESFLQNKRIWRGL